MTWIRKGDRLDVRRSDNWVPAVVLGWAPGGRITVRLETREGERATVYPYETRPRRD
jgi:hypothetical protein